MPFEVHADGTLRVVERLEGSASTDFGVPGTIAKRDTPPLAAAEGKRLAGSSTTRFLPAPPQGSARVHAAAVATATK